jgi:hypothetical protein
MRNEMSDKYPDPKNLKREYTVIVSIQKTVRAHNAEEAMGFAKGLVVGAVKHLKPDNLEVVSSTPVEMIYGYSEGEE